MNRFTRRSLPLLFAGALAAGIAAAAPAGAVTVDQLATQVATAASPEAIQVVIRAARAEGMEAADIARAFGRAYAMAEAANVPEETRGMILASFVAFKATANVDVALLDAAFTVGSGRSVATISGHAGAGGYMGSTTAVTTTNDNPSAH